MRRSPFEREGDGGRLEGSTSVPEIANHNYRAVYCARFLSVLHQRMMNFLVCLSSNKRIKSVIQREGCDLGCDTMARQCPMWVLPTSGLFSMSRHPIFADQSYRHHSLSLP